MEFLRITIFSVAAAVAYGVVHDEITAHLCVEYFTVAHPRVFQTQSPLLLGIGWGIIATWWVGLPLGLGLAAVCRVGGTPKLAWSAVYPLVVGLMIVTAIGAASAGVTGAVLVAAGQMAVPRQWVLLIPQEKLISFTADAWTHSASYIVGGFGGIVVIGLALRRRVEVSFRTDLGGRSPGRGRQFSG